MSTARNPATATYSGIARYLSGRSILLRFHTVLLRTDRSHCFELGRVEGWGGTGTAGFRKTVLIPLHSFLSAGGLPGRPRPRAARKGRAAGRQSASQSAPRLGGGDRRAVARGGDREGSRGARRVGIGGAPGR